jgi:hypothetical protein
VALLVMDTAQSKQHEQFRRWFQIGPDISVTKGKTALGLSATGFAGRLQDSDTSGRVKMFTGSLNPYQGYVFPAFRETLPRTTVLFQSDRTQEMSNVAAFSLGGAQYRAADARGKKPTFEVRVAKRKPVYLQINRSAANLTVTKVKKPKPRKPAEGNHHPGGHTGPQQ